MIGWRPVVSTVLATSMVGLVVLHAREDAPAPPCDAARSMRAQGMLEQARSTYVQLLSAGEQDGCVKAGLDGVTWEQCRRADRLADASHIEGMKAYVAIATAEPVRGAALCARDGMARIAKGAQE